MRRRSLLAPLLAVLLGLAGCVEAKEDWTFDRKGGGTYELVLRWNADLWRRAGDVLGTKVMRRMAGRGFPLRVSQLRDGLSGIDGVEIERLETRDTDTGLREIVLKVRFRHLRDLLKWDVMAGRTVRVDTDARAKGAKGAKDDPAGDLRPARARLVMEPIARVPVLDALAALLEAEQHPPPPPPPAARPRDPLPLERLGLRREAADLVWRMLKLPLRKVRLDVHVTLPGDVISVRGRPVQGATREASFTWDFAALRKADTDRTVRLRWQMLSLDKAPVVSHVGTKDPRARRPDGRPR